jgi:hypothetical protein
LPAQHIQRLLSQIDACEAVDAYFAALGGALLIQGRIAEALVHLEKALLLNPDLPGTQLDYAQALALSGQKSAAVQLVDQVSTRPDIKPELKQWLTELTEVKPTPRWRSQILLQLGYGRESNFNNNTSANSLSIVLPTGGTIEVPINSDSVAQSGQAHKGLALVQTQRELGPGQLRLVALAQTRDPLGLPVANTRAADIAGDYSLGFGPNRFSLRVSNQILRREEELRYRELSYGLRYEYANAQRLPCLLAAAGNWARQSQQEAEVPANKSRFISYKLEAACHTTFGSVTTVSWSQGRTSPQEGSFEGGAKNRQEITLRHEQPLAFAGRIGQISVWGRRNRITDSEATLPLLGSIVVTTQRNDFGLGYWWPVSRQWSIGLDLESIAQTSNNPLQKFRNRSSYLGLRWQAGS